MSTTPHRPEAQDPAAPAPSAWDVVRGLFRQRSFVVAVGVLLVAALGLNASVQYLQLHFKKLAVPIRQPFKQGVPEVMGDWVQVARDEVMSHDIVEALGTTEFLFCHYVNAPAVGKSPEALRREFSAMPLLDQRKEVMRLQQRSPEAVLALGLSYYTGSADTVAHIPERCYLADGYEIETQGTPAWPIDGRAIKARYLTFENTDRHNAPPCHVAYLFHVNGRYEASSLAVRQSLQNLFSRYGYYAKIELRSDMPDRAASETVMRDFLGAALPHVENALPDWSEYRDRE